MPRWSVGKLTGPRGAGLGNEVVAYAKAYLGAQAFGARLVHPPWSINARPYRRELGSSRADAVPYALARLAPGIDLSWDLIAATGEDDYLDACLKLRGLVDDSRRPVIVHSSGMAGAYLGIRRARAFLQSRVMSQLSASRAGLDHIAEAATRIVVGVHARGGDFRDAPLGPGVFNTRTPLEWQVRTTASFVERCTLPVTVVVCGDDSVAALVSELHAALPTGTRVVTGSSESPADLARLTWCDLLVPSVSSFSMLAAFLGDGLYAWPADHLHEAGGWRSIWGYDPQQQDGPTDRARELQQGVRVTRGMAQGADPRWPDWAVEYVHTRAALRRRESDLLYFGVVRAADEEPEPTP